ncbi:MAG: class 1 fructose-bisphosphatase [Nitrospiraceae bacterium]|nr:class 1 fructose-bisphosphatase [Nitrospiraceae bacterium]
MGISLTFSQVTLYEQTALLAEPELAQVLVQIGLVGKLVSHDLRRAGLTNILGTTGETNVQGETVKKLDEIANQTFVDVFQRTGVISALASEEMEDPVICQRGSGAKYVLVVDPLDGSSNTDCNMPLGTIFSVLPYRGTDPSPTDRDFLKPGVDQVAAGYLLYGSSTLLVYTAGQGVHGFTLDPWIGEYILSHRNIRMPDQGTVYAANEGNYHKWAAGTRRYCDYLKVPDKPTGRPYSVRYSGCLVADVHRLLLGGGIYFYPGETDKPEGKLRLLYEANPLGLVVEQAGGRASTGVGRILDAEPKKLHQRVPLFIGSRHDVERADAFIQGRA